MSKRTILVVAWAFYLPMACVNENKGASDFPDSGDLETGEDTQSRVEMSRPIGAPDFNPAKKQTMADVVPRAVFNQSLLDAFDESLRYDLLYPYYPTAQDSSYGGFVEDRSSTWGLKQDSDKFLAAQARYTWTASKAAQFYASNPTEAAKYLSSAAVGFEFLTRMWGGASSGFALMADRNGSNGRVGDKASYVVYANAFAVYASAAYYAASGAPEALTLAIDGYNYLDDHFHDSQYGGYYITASDKNKDTNINLHVIEALIELYQALPTSHALRSEVGSRVSELLGHFHDNTIHCPTADDCFGYPVLNQQWSASRNNVSFGHDLELSMLMVQAIVALGQDPLTSPYFAKIKKVFAFTFANAGVRSDGGIYYTGTYNNGNVSLNDTQLQWWPHAEGLGAACMLHRLLPDDPLYSDTINLVWGYIDSHFIDHNNNGWVRQSGDYGMDKAFEWHCNYHNGRALMSCLSWLSEGSCADTNNDGVCDHCVNGVQDEGETDLNCGGACNPCVNGDNCLVNADCESDYCGGGICGNPPVVSCSDGIQNQGEIGVDCGGPCPACPYSNAIWLEAEGGTLTGSPAFAINADGNASGGQYIQPTTNSATSTGPNRATYTFNTAAGTYKVWGRTISPNADDDSFWVSMDGSSFVKWNSIPMSSSWAWDDVHNSDIGGSAVTYSLSQGTHTLVVANREDGVKLDKLYVTAKGDTPSGLGGDVNPCTPTTCSASDAVCGTVSDGCGGTLSCGTCGTGEVCNASHQCVCAPSTCASQNAVCGTVSDGCGGTLSCGTCGTGSVCNGNQCVCVPGTCASQNAVCGTVSDGCGGTLSCGTCGTGEVCNASHQCEVPCVPGTCESLVVDCGVVDDGCAGSIDCGGCGTAEVCSEENMCVAGSGTGPFLESGGMVVIEAEHYDGRRQDLTTSDQWNAISVSAASGGTCMQVGPDSTTQYHTAQADTQTNAARIDYQVKFTTTGTWQLWVRGASTSSQGYASDSVHGGIDGVAQALNLDFPENGSYSWVKKTITVSSAGVHTVQLYMREDGFIADKIVLVTSSGYTPSSLGPSESARQ